MQRIEPFTEVLRRGEDLEPEQASRAAFLLREASVGTEQKYEFLTALTAKGESVEEVVAFASSFRELALDPQVGPWAERAIDVCGTGGDGAHTFNLSTAVSFIVAAAGVPVFKHGNRSITSKCGSADLLEAIGFDLHAPCEVQQASLEALNYCFFFAPAYHPAFKEIMPVRKALAAAGRRSIFNLLGPLINPGKPAYQLLGVYAGEWVDPLAQTLDALGLKSGLVVHGRPESEQGLDELSCAGENQLAGFGHLRGTASLPDLDVLGLKPCSLRSLKGGDVKRNLQIMRHLAECDGQSLEPGLLDSILLNAGAALWIAEQAPTLALGVGAARELIQSGALKDWLTRVENFQYQS